MTIEQIIVASCLAFLGVAHSVLGESGILKPLFAAEWSIDTPRWATDRILRFAWHLTSITWFAIAAVVIGADLFVTMGIMSLASAALIFVMLRGHLAWPIFLLAGLAAFREADVLTEGVLAATTVSTVAVLVAAGLLHVYWALGGSWMLDVATPVDDRPEFRPGMALTLLVAVLLFGFAGLVGLSAADAGPTIVRWLAMGGISVLVLRAIGDNKVAGFTKQNRDTPFGRADDAIFTPLIVFLALGATGALL